MNKYCKNCYELAEKLKQKEQECNTLKSQLDFAVRQKERFEQQCEALKSEGFTRESLITEQENEIDELKQENEELKEKLKREIKNTVDMERLAKSYGQDMLTYKQKKQIEIEELRQECEQLEYDYQKQLENTKKWIAECEQLQEKYEALKLENEEGYEIVAELKHECEELKKANQHIDANRQRKGSKLKRIEELISACETGYTDEFIQKIYGIIQESEPAIDDYSIIDRYRKALEEIERIKRRYLLREPRMRM